MKSKNKESLKTKTRAEPTRLLENLITRPELKLVRVKGRDYPDGKHEPCGCLSPVEMEKWDAL